MCTANRKLPSPANITIYGGFFGRTNYTQYANEYNEPTYEANAHYKIHAIQPKSPSYAILCCFFFHTLDEMGDGCAVRRIP